MSVIAPSPPVPVKHWKGLMSLHRAVTDFLPAYRGKHIRQDPGIDVRRLARHPEIALSHEALYKWFRSGTLPGYAARAFISIAAEPENLAALRREGRRPPTYADLIEFVR